ncbi:hypothetical protein PR048_014193 [Dryococelus australis]|uniref:Uncharacterized protein n=1 Tax=Dryococelus australis TaxID=614101 RepID=A0ABQ9HDM0_9NEOP|nr:hypothetical protein PR048_014193 [Dryococelus australis]
MVGSNLLWDRGGTADRALISHQGEPGSIPRQARSQIFARMMPLVAGFPRGSPVSPALAFRHCSILIPLHPHQLSRPRWATTTCVLVSKKHRQTPEVSVKVFSTIAFAVDLAANHRLRRQYGLRARRNMSTDCIALPVPIRVSSPTSLLRYPARALQPHEIQHALTHLTQRVCLIVHVELSSVALIYPRMIKQCYCALARAAADFEVGDSSWFRLFTVKYGVRVFFYNTCVFPEYMENGTTPSPGCQGAMVAILDNVTLKHPAQ